MNGRDKQAGWHANKDEFLSSDWKTAWKMVKKFEVSECRNISHVQMAFACKNDGTPSMLKPLLEGKVKFQVETFA